MRFKEIQGKINSCRKYFDIYDLDKVYIRNNKL